jgi:hypothetical protein
MYWDREMGAMTVFEEAFVIKQYHGSLGPGVCV